MPEHWYMLSWSQERTETGEKITVVTNTPCHLWMRWTLINPKIHKITRLRRGLAAMQDWYYCFDVYEDNEQVEPGDTLVHTFMKEPWPYCQERWFYFHGNVNGVPSPSTSPILYKHPIAPPPPLYADACYARNPTAGTADAFSIGLEISKPFIPLRTYNTDLISMTLTRLAADNPPHFARFAIYNAAISGLPTGDAIAFGIIAIDPPILPLAQLYTASVPLVGLTLGQTYGLSIRGEPTANYSPTIMARTKDSTINTCPSPYGRNHYRYYRVGTWQAWSRGGASTRSYELPERL